MFTWIDGELVYHITDELIAELDNLTYDDIIRECLSAIAEVPNAA